MKTLIKNIVFLLFIATTFCHAQKKETIYIKLNVKENEKCLVDRLIRAGFSLPEIKEMPKKNITTIREFDDQIYFKLCNFNKDLIYSKNKSKPKVIDYSCLNFIKSTDRNLKEKILKSKKIYLLKDLDNNKALLYPVSYIIILCEGLSLPRQ